MATGPVELLSTSFDLNGGIMSDSGILFCSNDIENLIINEIERIKGSKQRADTNSVCKALFKKHGLAEGVVVIAIDFMMKRGKLKKTFYAGRESFSIPDSTETNNESSKEVEKGTEKRISLDEDKAKKYREEILEVASMHESLKEDDISETSESEVCEEEAGELDNSDFIVTSEIMDSPYEKNLDSSKHGKNNEVCQDPGLLEQILVRLTDVEKRVDNIISDFGPNNENRLNSSRHALWGASTENGIHVKIFFDRISMLERENQKLANENLALKIENSNMKVMKFQGNQAAHNQNGNKKSIDCDGRNEGPHSLSTRPTYSTYVTKETTSPSPVVEENQIWKIPRVVSRAKHARFNDLTYPNSSIQTSNRYASLQDSTVEVESLEKKNDTPKKRIVRPGEDDYATVVKRRSQWSNDVMQGTKNMISIPGNKGYGNQNFPSRAADMEKADSSFKGQNEETNKMNTTTKSSNVAAKQWGDSLESNEKFRKVKNQSRMRSQKPTVSIVGDSMIRKIRRQDINREAPQVKTSIKTFPGATIEQMKSYIRPTIEEDPDGIIIVCGTNNLRSATPEEVANKMISLAFEVKKEINDVAISSIIRRTDSDDLERKRIHVNQLVRTGLLGTGMKFIEHDNILDNHLDKWGLHLNFHGINILTENLIDFINGE